jgi:hypothetical protein
MRGYSPKEFNKYLQQYVSGCLGKNEWVIIQKEYKKCRIVDAQNLMINHLKQFIACGWNISIYRGCKRVLMDFKLDYSSKLLDKMKILIFFLLTKETKIHNLNKLLKYAKEKEHVTAKILLENEIKEIENVEPTIVTTPTNTTKNITNMTQVYVDSTSSDDSDEDKNSSDMKDTIDLYGDSVDEESKSDESEDDKYLLDDLIASEDEELPSKGAESESETDKSDENDSSESDSGSDNDGHVRKRARL